MIRAFREAGADAPDRAVDPDSLGCKQDWIFRLLVARAVFIEADPGRFYLSEEGAARLRRMRALRITVFLVLALVLSLVVMLTNR
jgi:hypothetical protein